MNSRTLGILGLLAALAITPALARVDFIPIEGGVNYQPWDMTADGSKILLFGGPFGSGPNWTWTAEEGLVDIGGSGCSGQYRISFDGATIVGSVQNAEGKCEAAKYLGNQEWQLMGGEPGALPCGSTLSSIYGANNETGVGLFWRPQLCKAIGGTWDLGSATAGPILESTVPNRPTRGNDINNDGTIVVGWQDAVNGARQAAKWVNGVQELILNDMGRPNGEAIATNGDGTAIIGTGYDFAAGQGWIWREGQGMIPVGYGGIGINIQTVPVAISDDGNTAVGVTRNFTTFEQRGWIWTDKKGFQWLDDFLKGQNAAGWDLQFGSSVSADGNIITGWGFNPDGFIQSFIINLKATGNPNN